MTPVSGATLASLPITGLRRIRNLDAFDGPLLTHYVHPSGDHYLYYWCDCDETTNRWMVLRVSETSIVRLVSRFVPLDYVIPRSCKDDFVYFVDIDGETNIKRVTLTPSTAIPDDYIPAKGAYLDADLQNDRHSYAVLIEGDLSIPEIGQFPRLFSQAYALVYCLEVLKPGEFRRYPWRGGFSGMHFYRGLLDRVPREDRPAVKTFQYASPGFIRFSLHRPSAEAVAESVTCLAADRTEVRAAREDLYAYIRTHDLNQRPQTPADDVEHQERLSASTRNLLDSLAVPQLKPEDVLAAVSQPFEAAKIALSFATRLLELAKFQRDGLVVFPPN